VRLHGDENAAAIGAFFLAALLLVGSEGRDGEREGDEEFQGDRFHVFGFVL
jgi:hypothetical protein